MEKRTEQINGKIDAPLKRESIEFCKTHGISESELVNTALLTYFELYNALGPIRLMSMIQEALHDRP